MKHKLEPQHDDHVNVTPLIDIVMCLIIFFMICGKLAKDESSGNVTVPTAKLGQELPDKRDRLVINVPQSKRDNFGNQPAPVLEIRNQPVEMTKLTEYLRNVVKGNHDIKILIRADEALQYQYISPVLVSCAEAQIKSVHFSTRQRDK